MNRVRIGQGTHECPGGCGREDLSLSAFACPSCLGKLPFKLRSEFFKGGPDLVHVMARCKLWWENSRSGD